MEVKRIKDALPMGALTQIARNIGISKHIVYKELTHIKDDYNDEILTEALAMLYSRGYDMKHFGSWPLLKGKVLECLKKEKK